ncbi:DUF4214 domain-containing protein [Undibacterium seohonense]|uniref:DUF4214 domain-containing protein n=1 Tax=Undibacterium seohonense TaxID=1344950 RepID=A0ABR6X2K6_9BURK|nr:DUF4214 domain-containing protein [Undibacterium seohonense]MBC3807157.1 DUF4214 domain-containing protein [Undibacterium seohonense]
MTFMKSGMLHAGYRTSLALMSLVLGCGLYGCGGQSQSDSASYRSAPMSPAPMLLDSDVQSFPGTRASYTIAKLSVGYLVTDMVTNRDITVVRDKKQLRFADVTVNLKISEVLNQVSAADLRSVIELYIAFFNRVPDADGLAYWLGELRDGKTLDQIANSFYQAAIYFSAQTSYTADMSNQDFVKIIYRNVLGRSASKAPTDEEVNYWANELSRGISKGSMIRSMLNSARTFVNDPNWKFVPALLDGKLQVGMTFAVNHGLGYISSEDSILKTMAIAAAVTPTSTAEALKLIPVKDLSTNLAAAASAAGFAGICTPAAEKSWARGHVDDVYLWYRDVLEVPQNAEMTLPTYFDSLLVKGKDKFSFTSPQSVIDDFFQSGSSFSYGYSLLRQGSRLRVLFVEPGSPADLAGLKRGMTVASVDNTSLEQSANDIQYAALYPSKIETHTFGIAALDGSLRSVEMTSALVVKSPVLESKILNDNGKKIAYMVFNDHIRTAEQPLIDSIRGFRESGVHEIVLDLRYNGGGYLYIADELAAMIGGYRTAGSIFETLIHNDKYPEKTEYSSSWFYSYDTNSRPLPWLNVPRVFVLTGSRTCSASESIINGLSPFMEVILIGDKTCGKPYGFRQKNNCGTAYFAIEFSGVNALGKGDYVDGFAPQCSVADDLDHLLGDPQERRLAAALNYVRTGKCPAVTGMVSPQMPPSQASEPDPYPWRSIRLVR